MYVIYMTKDLMRSKPVVGHGQLDTRPEVVAS
jgi:hypothetical protein